MTLQKDVLEGLRSCKELSDEAWRKIMDNAFSALLGKPEIHAATNVHATKGDVVKESYAGLLATVAEAVRRDALGDSPEGATSLDVLLDSVDGALSAPRRDLLRSAYAKQRERLLLRFGQLGRHPPHVTDCTWTIDHVVKVSDVDEAVGPVYRIRMVTDGGNEMVAQHISFSCSTQQLQDLVYRLRDAVRHCERISSVH